MDDLRLFTSVRPPKEIVGSIHSLGDRIETAVGSQTLRRIRPENYHVTLQFLGNTPPSLVEPIVEAMQAAARQTDAFIELELGDAGAFPSARRPRTVWVGVHDVGGRLAAVERDLRARLIGLGIELDTRRFRPHVTVGYVRKQATPADRSRLAEWINGARTNDERSAGSSTRDESRFTVGEILLVRSVLGPNGSHYSHLHAVRLG